MWNGEGLCERRPRFPSAPLATQERGRLTRGRFAGTRGGCRQVRPGRAPSRRPAATAPSGGSLRSRRGGGAGSGGAAGAPGGGAEGAGRGDEVTSLCSGPGRGGGRPVRSIQEGGAWGAGPGRPRGKGRAGRLGAHRAARDQKCGKAGAPTRTPGAPEPHPAPYPAPPARAPRRARAMRPVRPEAHPRPQAFGPQPGEPGRGAGPGSLERRQRVGASLPGGGKGPRGSLPAVQGARARGSELGVPPALSQGLGDPPGG